MSQCEITKSDSICLFEIFKELKIKCENENQLNYENLIQFAVSFDWFRNQFYNWNKELYELHEVDKYKKFETKVTIDLDIIYNGLQKFTQIEQNLFWKSLANAIKEFTILERFTIKWTSSSYNQNEENICNDIINALQSKEFLRYLFVDLPAHTLKSLPHVPYLRELHLNVKIKAEDLIEFCKVNPFIQELSILSNEISGKLSDITLDENNLQKLEVLDLRMKPDIDAAEYTSLIKLPKLYYLRLRGQHQIGSLQYLFNDLALKKSSIRFLYMDDALLNAAEIDAISQLDSLEELKCGFIHPESLGQLSQLSKLTELRILTKHDVKKMLINVLKIFKGTKRDYISIHFHECRIDYDKNAELLKWILFENDVDASEYAILCELSTFRTLQIIGINDEIKSLVNLSNGFLSRLPQTLEHLQLSSNDENVYHIKLDCNEIYNISNLRSLKSLDCSFANISNISILGQLQHLEKLILTIPMSLKKEESESLKKLFILLASNSSSTLEYLDISGASIDLPSIIEMVKIKSIKKLKCSFSNVESIKILHKLDQLMELEIRSKFDFNQMSEGIFRILATSKTSIKVNCNGTSITYDNFTKTLILNMDKNAEATMFESLESLENCRRIFVTGEFKEKSFYTLLKALSNKKNNCVKELYIEHIPINYEESILVSQINTLEVLICTYTDPRSFQIFHSHCHFQRIRWIEDTFSNHILYFLNNSNGTIIIENNDRQIIYYKNEGKLILKNISCYESIFNANDYTCLGNLDNLETLQIIGQHESGSLKELFKTLASRSSLNELIITGYVNDNNDGTSELLEIAKIKSIKKLKCKLSNAVNAVKLTQLQKLQELTSTDHQYGSLLALFQEFSLTTSSALEFLSIETEGLSIEELKAIAKIRTLKILKCILINTAIGLPNGLPNGLPPFPYLTELYISSYQQNRLFIEPECFENSALQNLNIMGAPLREQDIAALAHHKSLKKLQINLENIEHIDLLTSITELEELHIVLIRDFNLPVVQIHLPKFPVNIQKLIIKNLTIDVRDFKQILQLPALKSLDCILDIDENENIIEFDQLEELIITLPKQGSIKHFLSALTNKPSSTLKHLFIFDELLDDKDMIELSQMRSLTYLQCGLLCDDSFQHLKQLINLKRLIITSDYYLDSVSKHLLNIIRECTSLEFMDLSYCDEEIGMELIHKILDVLKNVRDPNLQDPLRLLVANHLDFPQEHMNSVEQKYLIIQKNNYD